jgi:hypothetical protein
MRTREQRRLDSLARLLERNHTCAAVCSVGGKLFIATNKFTAGSRSETKDKIIKSVDKINGEVEEMKLFFQDLVVESIKALSQGTLVINDEEIKSIAGEFLKPDGSDTWNQTTIKQLKEKYKTPARLYDAVFVNTVAERLATDLWKVKKEFRDNIQDNLLHQALEIELLTASEKDVHAEMTIINKVIELFEEEKATSPIYIGISKKCCNKCTIVIEAVNEVLSGINIDDSEEEMIDSIRVAGSHPQEPSSWVKPQFLSKDSEFCKKIQVEYAKIIKEKSKKESVSKNRSEHDMGLELSASPSYVDDSSFKAPIKDDEKHKKKKPMENSDKKSNPSSSSRSSSGSQHVLSRGKKV